MAAILGRIITIDRSPKTEQDSLDADLIAAGIEGDCYLDTMILASDNDKIKVLILYSKEKICMCMDP